MHTYLLKQTLFRSKELRLLEKQKSFAQQLSKKVKCNLEYYVYHINIFAFKNHNMQNSLFWLLLNIYFFK